MPKVKITFPKYDALQELQPNIEKYRAMADMDEKTLALYAGLCPKSYNERKKHPEMWRLQELSGVAKALKVGIHTLMGWDDGRKNPDKKLLNEMLLTAKAMHVTASELLSQKKDASPDRIQ